MYVDPHLIDPVGTGEAEIACSGGQHRNHVTRLEHFRVRVRQGQRRTVAPFRIANRDSGSFEEGNNFVKHTAFGQGNSHGVFVGLVWHR